MMQILAMHGWAGHAGAWSHWRKCFEQRGATWNSADQGYGGGEPVPKAWVQDPARKVLIAHSLGLHLLPASVLEQATTAVLLGSFESCRI